MRNGSLPVGLFESLAARLIAAPDRPRSIGISATLSGEGATTMAVGLALSLARSKAGTVLLVDANDVDPQLTLESGRADAIGLSEHLAGRPLSEVIEEGAEPGLWFVPQGSALDGRPRPESISGFLRCALARFGYVIVDLPPASAEARLVPWLSEMDRSVLVVRKGGVSATHLRHALEVTRTSRSLELIANEFEDALPAGR